MTVSTTLDAPF